MKFKRFTKLQVLAHIRKHGETEVYMIASKMRFSLDHAFSNTFVNVSGGWVGVKGNENRTFDDQVNAFVFYNCTYETGYYTHYYLKVS